MNESDRIKRAILTERQAKIVGHCDNLRTIGVLIAGPLAIAGIAFEINALKEAATLLFWCCWIVAIPMGAVFLARTMAGRYKSIEARDWNEQVW